MKVTANEHFALIPEWVLYADTSPAAKVVYCVLHRYANSNGKCFPSRKSISGKANIGLSTLDRAIDELVALGAVKVARRTSESGSPTSNEYTVILNRPLSNMDRPYIENEQTPLFKNDNLTKAIINQSQEPLPTSTEVEVSKPNPVDQIAKDWWDSRPKKPLGKKAWWSLRAVIQAALDRDYTPQEITDALNRYGTIPSLPALDRELQRIRPQTKWATQMQEIGNYLETRTHNPFDLPTQGELNP
jgi:hypothetical protein